MNCLENSQNKILSLTKEDEYKECLESTTNGIIYLDNKMCMTNVNDEAERICGIGRSNTLGKRVDIVFKNYGENFLQIFNVSEEQEVKTANLKLEMNDQIMYLHVDTLKIVDTSGEVNGIVVILQDMSAVRAAIKQIQTTQMLMSLGEIAAGVAHHVRTPLTTIGGYLQIMLKRLENDQYTVRRDVLEMLLTEVSYINDVVKELVLFAKPPVQKQPDVSMNDLVDEVLLLTFKQVGSEKININKQLTINLPTIIADSNLLKQALINIIQNAIESMTGDGTLGIKSWVNAQLGMLVIAIEDTGGSVPDKILPMIFEPFYTTKSDRMGLGLPIANRIIAEHGGFINVSPKKSGGTKVHIYLPLIDDELNRLNVVQQQLLNLQ